MLLASLLEMFYEMFYGLDKDSAFRRELIDVWLDYIRCCRSVTPDGPAVINSDHDMAGVVGENRESMLIL